MLNNLKIFKTKLLLKKTMLYDSIKIDSKDNNIIKIIYLETCLAFDNVNELISKLEYLKTLINNDNKQLLEELEFLLDNFYIGEDLIRYCKSFEKEEEFITNSFFTFFKMQNNIDDIKFKEKNINLSYFIYSWEEFYKEQIKSIIFNKKIDYKLIKQLVKG